MPAPTEEESAEMLAETFSADDADLSLLPDSGVFSDAGADAAAADEPGPFDADGPFGAEDHWDALGSGSGDADGADHGEDFHAQDDSYDAWDPLFGGDV
ncbi:hypothetical protein [Planobispora longispora]|uniref:hypothetical protein n=1 Tax=Planobispora longispora TaxID=28887 RepID=UPI001942ADF2|nr:hypothetical protein [Planobispora longispora]BFE80203.1 hypothetical protein GCM10020093_028040 [Planobispora longispora]